MKSSRGTMTEDTTLDTFWNWVLGPSEALRSRARFKTKAEEWMLLGHFGAELFGGA